MPTVLLSLGSNLDPQRYLRSAQQHLHQQFADIIFSPCYRTRAVGFKGNDFLNGAAILETAWSLPELENWLHTLEDNHGRIRDGKRYGNRSLDVDVVYYGQAVIDEAGQRRIPRPEIKHAFVLKPLADIAPTFIDPVCDLSILELWQQHADYGLAMDVVSLAY